jgi:hypothetical protein
MRLAQLEDAPDSKIQREAVGEALQKAGADQDQELLRKVKEMMDAVQTHAPQTAVAIGVDIKDIKAASLRIADIVASGTASGLKAQGVDVSGSFVIEGVRAGESGADPSKILAATVLKTGAREGEIRWTLGGRSPIGFAAEHSVEDHEELAHATSERRLGMQPTLAQPCVEILNDRVSANRRHLQYAPHLSASAPIRNAVPGVRRCRD